jgi:hypothetical protein
MNQHSDAISSDLISLQAAVTLTDKSRRTLWRRVSDGSLQRGPGDGQGRTMVWLDEVLADACLPFTPEDLALVRAADAGDAQAQSEVGLLFLEAGHHTSALYWLDLAVRQKHADALHWLARCHIGGWGCPPDENLGLMWLARAAALGHAVSTAQMAALKGRG